jgi:hypothetical protein
VLPWCGAADGTNGLAGFGGGDAIAHELTHPVGGERFARCGQEQRAIVIPGREIGLHILAVFVDPLQSPRANRDHPVLLPLPWRTSSVPNRARRPSGCAVLRQLRPCP